jgi:ribosomal protein S18 acetylase RimI-like enzyme
VGFRFVGPGDEPLLADLFDHLDTTFFRPHSFAPSGIRRIVNRKGRDIYLLLVENDTALAYGLLRGWDEGYSTPSLGIAVRTERHRQGIGRRMMLELHRIAGERGAQAVRLRVHDDNVPARRLYGRSAIATRAGSGASS